jgi:hypothetical protein
MVNASIESFHDVQEGIWVNNKQNTTLNVNTSGYVGSPGILTYTINIVIY